MIIVFALAGGLVGWLLIRAGDYLLRFSGNRAERSSQHAIFPLISAFVTGGLFALLYGLYGISVQTAWMMVTCAFFVLIAMMDYKYRLVLNILTYPGIVIALVVNVVLLQQPVLNIVLGMVFAFGLFYVTAMVRPGGIGGGDMKLAALIGATFGFPQVLWVLIVSAASSAVAIAFMLISRQRTTKDTIPYAPFLCLGAVAVLVFHTALLT